MGGWSPLLHHQGRGGADHDARKHGLARLYRTKYLKSHNILDIYNLNKKLIDLNEIPEVIVKNFYDYYNISIQ